MTEIEEIKELIAEFCEGVDKWETWRLANEANVSHENEQADSFLTHVRDQLTDVLSTWDVDELAEAFAEQDLVGKLDYDGRLHEIADGAPDIYTHTRWLEFTGMEAWTETDDDGLVASSFEGGGDMTEAIGIILYQIALRLVNRILELLQEAYDEAFEDAHDPVVL